MLKRIKVGELRRVVNESERARNEFRPVIYGSDETKRINKEAYRHIKDETSKYDGGVSSKGKSAGESEFDKNNGKGMESLRFDNAPKSYKDRVRSQVHGYASSDAEKLHSGETKGNFSNDENKELYGRMKKRAQSSKTGRDRATEIGLTGRELPKKEVEDLDGTMFESKKIKRLSFKTKFLNEDHVASRIPDDLKTEGNKFIMRGSDMTEYLVEWKQGAPEIRKKLNMNIVNEEKERIKSLWEYKPSEHDGRTDNKLRLQENEEISSVLDKVRKLMS